MIVCAPPDGMTRFSEDERVVRTGEVGWREGTWRIRRSPLSRSGRTGDLEWEEWKSVWLYRDIRRRLQGREQVVARAARRTISESQGREGDSHE